MKIEIVNFKGYIKWLVTSEVIFVDPLYLDELKDQMEHKYFKTGCPK